MKVRVNIRDKCVSYLFYFLEFSSYPFKKYLRSNKYSLPMNWIRLPRETGIQGLASSAPTASYNQATHQMHAFRHHALRR